MRILTFDTETIDLKDLSIFDIGFTIFDTKEETQESEGFIIKEIYEAEKFKKAYYYEKNKDYYKRSIEQGLLKVITVKELKIKLREKFIESKVDVISAFNINFDIRAINYTLRSSEPEGKQLTFANLNRIAKIVDIGVAFAIEESKRGCYKCWCERNGYLTAAKNVKTDVQTVYRYIKNKEDFNESHDAIHDSQVEADILSYSMIRSKSEEAFINLANQNTLANKRPYIMFKST